MIGSCKTVEALVFVVCLTSVVWVFRGELVEFLVSRGLGDLVDLCFTAGAAYLFGLALESEDPLL